MNFEEEYVKESEAAEPENKDKTPVSNDAYAIGHIIQNLIDRIAHAELSLK